MGPNLTIDEATNQNGNSVSPQYKIYHLICLETTSKTTQLSEKYPVVAKQAKQEVQKTNSFGQGIYYSLMRLKGLVWSRSVEKIHN